MAPYSRFYRPIHCGIEELVDEATFQALGESGWQLFDPLLLSTLDRIRERYKAPVIINNWKAGGSFDARGFRPSKSVVGAPLSAHRRGQACDFDVKGMTSEEVRKDIRDHQEHMDFQFINRVELDTSWVHIDVANVPNRIVFFKP